MSAGLSRLKGLAEGLGAEIADQNLQIDRIHEKATGADFTIGSQNTQMKHILKRWDRTARGQRDEDVDATLYVRNGVATLCFD